MIIAIFGTISSVLVIVAFLLWLAEETKIGSKFTSWLLKKIDGSHFEHLE